MLLEQNLTISDELDDIESPERQLRGERLKYDQALHKIEKQKDVERVFFEGEKRRLDRMQKALSDLEQPGKIVSDGLLNETRAKIQQLKEIVSLEGKISMRQIAEILHYQD